MKKHQNSKGIGKPLHQDGSGDELYSITRWGPRTTNVELCHDYDIRILLRLERQVDEEVTAIQAELDEIGIRDEIWRGGTGD